MMKAFMEVATSEGFFPQIGGGYHRTTLQEYCKKVDLGGSYSFSYHNPQPKKTPGFNLLNPLSLTESECSKLLEASEEFNVSSVSLSSLVDFSCCIIWPKTLEDYFTLFHQNMEQCIGHLRDKEGFGKAVLPKPLADYYDLMIKKAALTGSQGTISSIGVEDGLIQVVIDIPLRQHAGKIILTYDPLHPEKIKTRVEMFGNAEHARWELTAACAGLVGGDLKGLVMETPEITFPHATRVVFEFTTENLTTFQMQALGNYLNNISNLSIERQCTPQYLKAVVDLRAAFGSTLLPITPHNMSVTAGFVIAPEIIKYFKKKGDLHAAKSVFQLVSQLKSTHPWMHSVLMHYDKRPGGAYTFAQEWEMEVVPSCSDL